MVDDTLRSIPGPPHIEPPRWPGHTSVSGASASRRSCSEWKIPRAPSSLSTARSGRAMSPTNSVSPVSTAQGSSERAVSMSANAVCSGRWPGVCSARTFSAPSPSSQPSSNGSWSYSGPASEWMWTGAAVAATKRARAGDGMDVDGRAGGGDEAAVAGDVVSVVVGFEDVLDADAEVAGEPQVLVD